MTLTNDTIRMIANGLELPSDEAKQAMREELKRHGLNLDTMTVRHAATEIRRLRGVPNPDAQ